MAYAATASVLALCVDISRIPVYLIFRYEDIIQHSVLTLVLVISALLGVKLGKKWLVSIKSEWVQKGVMISIVASGVYFIFESGIFALI